MPGIENIELAESSFGDRFGNMSREQLRKELVKESTNRKNIIEDIKRREGLIDTFAGPSDDKIALDAADIDRKKGELEESENIIRGLCALLDIDEIRLLGSEEEKPDRRH